MRYHHRCHIGAVIGKTAVTGAKKQAGQPIPAGQGRRGHPAALGLPARATNSSGVHPPTLAAPPLLPRPSLVRRAYRSLGGTVTSWPKCTASWSLGLDVLVVPSRLDGRPNVVMEANA